MRRSALFVALAISLVAPTLAAAQARPAEPLWKESQGAVAPPDILRLNDFMHALTYPPDNTSYQSWRAPSVISGWR